MNLFFHDPNQGVFVSWNTFIDDISNSQTFNPYCNSNSFYQIFKCIVLSMLIQEPIILLDADFSESELLKLTGKKSFSKFNKRIKRGTIPIIKNKTELIILLQNTSANWEISLYSSGTTGIPKKVKHSFNSITRFVKVSERNAKSVWGFAFNPSHMAGVQVFFQALLNGNTIIKLFDLPANDIKRSIKESKITHISATPTFYSMLLPCDDSFPSVLRVTSGGEKYNSKTTSQLSLLFPNAKLTNVYATTETGTLLASENDIFRIKPEYEHLIRIENNELIINNVLMGNSDFSFDEWYRTGDIIEVVANVPLKFRFVSRKSDMINTGGYKVNPLEVEEAILEIPNIKNVRVYSRPNSILGNIVCCDVVCDNDEIDELWIRTFLQKRIQEFKIPRFIRFVEKIAVSRTGKTKRN